MLLNNKVVIVSGIGPGLGGELAKCAAREGARLVVAARTASKLDRIEADIHAFSLDTPVLKIPTDITSEADCQNLVNQANAHYGRIDGLINSAFHPGAMDTLEHVQLQGWRQAMEVNLFGSMQLSMAVVECFKEQFNQDGTGGAIVNINTMATRKPLPTQAGYAASKAALATATAYMAKELGKYRIRVNSAFMGWMWGAPVKQYFEFQSKKTGQPVDVLKRQVETQIPLGEMPTDTECARAAIFLASDYASVITGACLDVNGGEYIPC